MITAFIQQPYFWPWLGYLAKIRESDIVILLDDADYRRDHLARTRVLSSAGIPIYLSVPIGASRGTPLNTMELPRNRGFAEKFRSTISVSYGRANNFRREIGFINELLDILEDDQGAQTLAQSNVLSLRAIASKAGLGRREFVLASKLSGIAERTCRTIALCRSVGANTLVVGDGGMLHAHRLEDIRNAGIDVVQVPYFSNHPRYEQIQRRRLGYDFIAGLSTIDALLNVGESGVRKLIGEVQSARL